MVARASRQKSVGQEQCDLSQCWRFPRLHCQPLESYIYEVKWDGIRVTLQVHEDSMKILSRSGRDITKQFPELVAARRSEYFSEESLMLKLHAWMPGDCRYLRMLSPACMQ